MINKLYKLYEDTFLENKDKAGLVIVDKEYKYSVLHEMVNEWADAFTDLGIKKSDRVMISTDDRLYFIISWIALWKIEAIPIPIEPVSSSHEIIRAIESGHPNWVISENPTHLKGMPSDFKKMDFMLKDDWIVGCITSSEEWKSMDNSAFYCYTSGTTGTPKCVMYDLEAAYAIIDSLIDAFKLSNKDVFMTPLPSSLPSVIFTAFLPSLASGATLVVLDEPIPTRALKVMKQQEPTVFFAVPYFYRLLIDCMKVRNEQKFNRLRLCVATSAYLDEKTFTDFYELTGVAIRSIFCSSEAFYCTYNPYDDIGKLRHTVGIPLKGVQMRIADANDNIVEPMVEGEIQISGTHKSSGYFYRKELEEKVYKNGWVHTGDMGYIDSEGYLCITGRLSDTVNVGGYLVNPLEVESVINSFEGVNESMIVGQRDDEVGEIVVAKVVVKDNKHVDKAELIKHCKSHLLPFKVPNRIEFIEELPKSRYGKIRRLS